jgi:hypothetical protein
MKRYLRNRGKILIFMMLMATLTLSVFFYKMALGFYAAKYTESAHGNATYGVNRIGLLSFGYSKGNCVQCHEQHASIGGPTAGPYQFLLFDQNNPSSQKYNFCFQCHKSGGVTNYTYSKNFGGGSQIYTTIYDAFNPLAVTASSHKRNIGFTSNNNACVVCHNPHTAEKNYDPVALTALGGVNTAIRCPGDYAARNTNLWGDEDLAHASPDHERMIDYDARYQAPYYGGIGNPSTGPFEPANNSTHNGSNLPNYRFFCMNQCHGRNDVSSTRYGTLKEIDWDATGDVHGKNSQPSGLGVTVPPYIQIDFNYVLSCTDCHEPHGSTNEWLLRTCVNGKNNISVPGPYQWLDFCTACHTITPHQPTWDSTTNCSNNNGQCHQHGNLF